MKIKIKEIFESVNLADKFIIVGAIEKHLGPAINDTFSILEALKLIGNEAFEKLYDFMIENYGNIHDV